MPRSERIAPLLAIDGEPQRRSTPRDAQLGHPFLRNRIQFILTHATVDGGMRQRDNGREGLMRDDSGREPVIVTVGEGVGHLRLNKPEQLNALDFEVAEHLDRGLSALARDGAVRAVVISGAGRSFMAGGDLKVFSRDLAEAPATAGRLIDLFHSALRTIKRMPQPVIAAVAGPVAGGGLGLAAACDLCIAAENATFLSAYTRLGTNPDGGTTWSLTRLLGPRRALEVALLNESVDARTALGLGLVNRVVPEGELESEALALARRLAEGSAAAQARVKRLVQAAVTGTYEEQLELEKKGFVESAGTADFREGITAFFEKRKPRFAPPA
jgi:2-(1,2-epoxy-1,2-dihydrophenyl)acetyl-CoA isomerase